MRPLTCLVLFGLCQPSFAQNKLAHDFRGNHFDNALVQICGPKDKNYVMPEKEGLRIRYTGADAAPQGNPAGIISTFKARGNFVATIKYEILHMGKPTPGTGGVGVELYLMLDNPNKDGVSLVRTLNAGGNLHYFFTVRTADETGKRISKDAHSSPAFDRGAKGSLRLGRVGSVVIGSFADGDGAQFEELQRSTIGTADVRLFRFNGHSGGDAKAVLDLRVLEVTIEGLDLSNTGKFAFAAPLPVAPEAPIAESPPAPGRRVRLMYFGILLIGLPLIAIGVGILIWHSRKRQRDEQTQANR
jgi:hypothetical protein